MKNCDIVIENQPTNVKAYFRRGNARMNANLIEEAKKDFIHALSMDKNNSEILAALKTV